MAAATASLRKKRDSTLMDRRTTAFFRVDARISSVRLRSIAEVLDELESVCPGLTVSRAARSSGMFLRLLLNCGMAIRVLWKKKQAQLPARWVQITEVLYLLHALLVVLRRLTPLARAAAIAAEAPRSTSRLWRDAAAAASCVGPLASFSQLSYIPRVKTVLPGVTLAIREERARYHKEDVQDKSPSQKAFAIAAATSRILSFGLWELAVVGLGLLALHEKLSDFQVKTASPRHISTERRRSSSVVAALGVVNRCLAWLPFVGMANQVTGVVDQEQLRVEAVLRSLFTKGGDRRPLDDIKAVQEFNGVLLHELCYRHGKSLGLCLFLSLTSVDYQKLLVVVQDLAGDEGEHCSPSSSPTSASRSPPPPSAEGPGPGAPYRASTVSFVSIPHSDLPQVEFIESLQDSTGDDSAQ
mmetsp:Transcript_62438/g.136506  ORF Transcript_62438/g.136506 Transcript_62438/m.136506 type:complete len:413 (-) Transcript_62438:12-1250(-)